MRMEYKEYEAKLTAAWEDAARAAARAAILEDARATVWATTIVAAWDAWDAARVAECELQKKRLLELLDEETK